MKPLLSIAIPSNNRTELLDEAIQSILAEPGFTNACEICISDNSSGSSTETLMAHKASGAPRIVYRRSLDAPSLDENVNQVIMMASGDYVWIFGDDDLIVPKFLPRLLEYLQRVSPDIVLVNSCSFQTAGLIEEVRMPKSEVRIYGPKDDNAFLSDFGAYLTYVPCLVIRRTLWLENFRKENVGTFFAHIDAVCRAKRGHTAHFLPEPGISMRLHFQTWVARHFEIWNVHFPEIIWGLGGYSDAAKHAVIMRHPLKSLKRLLGSRAYGRFNLEIWRKVLLGSKNSNAMVKTFGFIIAMLPREVFRLLYIGFIRAVRSKHHPGFSPRLALAQLRRASK